MHRTIGMTADQYAKVLDELFDGHHETAAGLLGVHRQTSWGWETGRYPVPLTIAYYLAVMQEIGIERTREILLNFSLDNSDRGA